MRTHAMRVDSDTLDVVGAGREASGGLSRKLVVRSNGATSWAVP